jgi:DNA-binding NtrC family response regulator
VIPEPSPAGGRGGNSPGAAENPAARILVVDDEALLRWSIVEMLTTAGYAVADAASSREAQRLLEGHDARIGALLLDFRLPDATGLDVLRAARLRGLTCPAILMTAYGSSETIALAAAAGVYEVVTKPFDLLDMLHLVQTLVPPLHR